ncbi:MAG: J domain-containing protein [Haloarculaceae archaeon]
MPPRRQETRVFEEVLEALDALPESLVLGVLLGLGCSLFVAGLFAAGERLSPTRAGQTRTWSGDDRRREEIRHYLRAIGEPFAEAHRVGSDTVAFYLPERDVAITFDARAFYRIERSQTTAVLVEHEMPGVHLGHRLPFETPPVDLGGPAEPTADPTERAFAVLGLPTTASRAEVRAAYRERVKEVHPDHGGDRESFRRVREAYTTAKRATS